MNDLMVAESPVQQGVRESIAYTVDLAPWGGAPSSISITIYDQTDADQDVTSTVSTGSASVVGTVMTLPTIHSLTRGHIYWVSVGFTLGGYGLAFGMQIVAVR